MASRAGSKSAYFIGIGSKVVWLVLKGKQLKVRGCKSVEKQTSLGNSLVKVKLALTEEV